MYISVQATEWEIKHYSSSCINRYCNDTKWVEKFPFNTKQQTFYDLGLPAAHVRKSWRVGLRVIFQTLGCVICRIFRGMKLSSNAREMEASKKIEMYIFLSRFVNDMFILRQVCSRCSCRQETSSLRNFRAKCLFTVYSMHVNEASSHLKQNPKKPND